MHAASTRTSHPVAGAAPRIVGRPNHPGRLALLALNLVGGSAVLASYVHGIATHAGSAQAAWGGVPESLWPLYTTNMFLAAAGYFAFSWFVLAKLDPERARVAGLSCSPVFLVLYALVLVPSALWMPLTFWMLEAPSVGLWWAIRAVLAAVGVGSVGLLLAIALAAPHDAPGARRTALAGCLPFVLQTAVLDALVWPAWFPV